MMVAWMSYRRRALVSVAAVTLATGMIAAERASAAPKPFSGEDAAYIDWAWKNCGTSATPKERELVDTASKAAGDKFQTTYQQQYNMVIGQTPDAAASRRMCESIKSWYGSGGSRIDGLVAEKGAPLAQTGQSIGKAAQRGGGSGRGGRGAR